MISFSLVRVYEEHLATLWNYTFRNLETAYNKFSSTNKLCQDLSSEKIPHGSISVRHYLTKRPLNRRILGGRLWDCIYGVYVQGSTREKREKTLPFQWHDGSNDTSTHFPS